MGRKSKEKKLRQAQASSTGGEVKKDSKRKPAKAESGLRIFYIITAATALLLYANTFNHGYVYDDFSVITGNSVSTKGISAIPEIFRTSYWYGMTGTNDAMYRPLSLVSFAIEYQLAPNNATLSHIMNVLLYALSALLMLKLLMSLFKDHNRFIPLIITLLWVAHPLHSEVVANIKSRDEILSCIFILLTMQAMITGFGKPGTRNMVAGAIFYFLALLSKENGITALAFIPLTLYFFNGTKKQMVQSFGVLAAVAALYLSIRFAVLATDIGDSKLGIAQNALLAAPDNATRMATAIKTLGLYLFKFFLPLKLASDYSYNEIPVSGLADPGFLASFAVLAAMFAYAVWAAGKKEITAYGILFFFITISIVSNVFVIIGSNMADRFMFMPSLGLIIAVVFFLNKLVKIPDEGGSGISSLSAFMGQYRLYAILLCSALVLLSVKTITRNTDWKSNLSLFSADVETSPKSAKLKVYYGKELVKQLKNNEVPDAEKNSVYLQALTAFKEAAEIDPTWSSPFIELGQAAVLQQDNRQAIAYYAQAGKLTSNDDLLMQNMGNAYFRLGSYDTALTWLRSSYRLNPGSVNNLESLGSCFVMQQRFDSAIFYYQKALVVEPTRSSTLRNLGVASLKMGRLDESIRYYEQALQAEPDNNEVKNYLQQVRDMKAGQGK